MEAGVIYKACSACNVAKSIEDFGARKDSADGHTGKCKDCIAVRGRQWRKNNLESASAIQKKYRAKNKPAIAKYNAEWFKKNLARAAECAREYRARSPESARKSWARWAEKLPDAYIAAQLKMRKLDCPAELVEMKREQIEIYRLSKRIKSAIIEQQEQK